MKKSKIFVTAIIIAFVISILIIVLFNICLKKNTQIKIGLILSFTGKGKYTSDELLSGIKFAVDKHNKWSNGKIKLIIRDCETDPDKAVEIFYEIEKKEKPLFYITCLSSVSLKLAPEAEKNKVTLFCLTTAAKEITENKKYVYRYWPQAINEAETLFKILQKIKIKKLGLLYLNDIFGISIKTAVNEKNNKRYKIKSEPFELNENNFDKIINKLIDNEAVYIGAYDSHYSSIIKSLINNNYNGFIIGTNGIIISYLRGDFVLPVFYASCPLIYDVNYQFNKIVKENYKNAFNKNFNHFSANGYDMANMVLDLIKDKKIDRIELEKLLSNGFVHTGVFGDIILEKNSHDMAFDFYPVKVDKNKILYTW